MKTTLIGGALFAAVVALAATAQDAAREKAHHSFSTAPVNARGIAGLEDLLGKPVLVEFWGTM
jgi:hypothetical protein